MRIVSFFMGDPGGYVQRVHDAGGIVLHTVGTAEEARRAVASGVDVVVAQGWEAGGHVWGTVATLPLVPAVVDAVAPVPVIAAGGIGDARGVAAVLALGAQAAWLGTRFLLAQEMPVHEEYRRALIAAAETDPQRYDNLYSVGWPDSPHRALRNSTADAWQAAGRAPLAQRPGTGDVIAHFASGEAIVRYEPAPPMAGTTGEIEALSMWAGQSVALAEAAPVSGRDRGRADLRPVSRPPVTRAGRRAHRRRRPRGRRQGRRKPVAPVALLASAESTSRWS